MATGTVYYWNGISGWIKQTGVDNVPTDDARDVMVLLGDVTGGTIDEGSTVNFSIDFDNDPNPWRARNVVVS
jgi:hypothetical protein